MVEASAIAARTDREDLASAQGVGIGRHEDEDAASGALSRIGLDAL